MWVKRLFALVLMCIGLSACPDYETEQARPPVVVAKPKGCADATAFYVDSNGAANNPLLQVQCREVSGRITVYLRRVNDSIWTTYTLRPDLEEK
jgi:hypothetical protein